MLQIAKTARNHDHEVITFSKKWKNNPIISGHQYIGTRWENIFNRILSPLISIDGVLSVLSTGRLIRQLKCFSPDVIQFHNLHGWYLNYGMLFQYIKKNKIRTVWTLHDCWPFTGQCSHFVLSNCDKWKTGCHHCRQYKRYPQMLFDRTQFMWRKKREWFTGVDDLIIVTPSLWLKKLVEESFLGCYPVKMIHNGIDLSVFQPTESHFRKQYHCEEKHIILGVAFGWGVRKGLDVFVELSKRLNHNYQIVLVGTDDKVDESMPDNIISIHRTANQRELAEIYTAADVFVNPTREDNFPTVNMEALACGTPVVTFCTGGSPEALDDTCGVVVEQEDLEHLEMEIIRICQNHPFSEKACMQKAEQFDMFDRFEEYIRIYEGK